MSKHGLRLNTNGTARFAEQSRWCFRGARRGSSALAEATNMALGAAFGELQLRTAVRARSDERLAAVARRLEHRRLLKAARGVAHHHVLRLERELRRSEE